MELDPKINSVHDILTPFDTKEAANFIGEYCAFADGIEDFKDIGDSCNVFYGELKRVKENENYPFEYELTVSHRITTAKFCLPYAKLKKEYRPFESLEEFTFNYPLGVPVTYKDFDYKKTELITSYWVDDDGEVCVLLGSEMYSFLELFEIKIIENGVEHPFGVKVSK